MTDIMWCPVCMKYHASTLAECCKGPVVYTSSAGYSPLLDAMAELNKEFPGYMPWTKVVS